MSKKKRAARTELVEAKVAAEREWMHARWMERLTYRQIAALAAAPVEHGGLGILVSHAGVKAMVAAYREDRGDVTMSREERLERQSDELDEVMRHLRGRVAKAAEIGGLDVHAVKLLLDAGKREADLHGLAAPTEIHASIVTTTAVEAELEAMLARIPESEEAS